MCRKHMSLRQKSVVICNIHLSINHCDREPTRGQHTSLSNEKKCKVDLQITMLKYFQTNYLYRNTFFFGI